MARYILVSDIHYTVEETPDEYRRLHPEAEASLAAGTAFGYTQAEKVQTMLRHIRAEHEQSPLDGVFFLGDLSIDDYGYRNLPENFCKKLTDAFATLPCPVYALPGNHDSYPADLWRAATGHDRQYTVATDSAQWILLDTFAGTARGASGAPFTGTDANFLRHALAQCDDRPVFLLAHMVKADDCEDLRALIAPYPQVRAVFRGHSHIAENVPCTLPVPLIDVGGYAYYGMRVGDTYTFQHFDPSWAWGYQLIDTTPTVRTMHRMMPLHYTGSNGEFDFPGRDTAWQTL